MPLDVASEALFALCAARDRWERTEQLPRVVSFVCLSDEELRALVAGEGLLWEVLRRDVVAALDEQERS